jgi:hypothetical protein
MMNEKTPSLHPDNQSGYEYETDSMPMSLDTLLLKNSAYKMNELNTEELGKILSHYQELKENKARFLNNVLRAWNKTLYKSLSVVNVPLFIGLFIYFHHLDTQSVHHTPDQGMLVGIEFMCAFIFSGFSYMLAMIYNILYQHTPRWYKKRWLKNKVDDVELFNRYQKKLSNLLEQKSFHNSYFAYLKLQLAQIEKDIEQSAIFKGKELREIHAKVTQLQTSLLDNFAYNAPSLIHNDIVKIEILLAHWRKIKQQNSTLNNPAINKASGSDKVEEFLKQHQEFMKSTGMDNQLQMIKDPENSDNMVKTML